MRLAILAPKIIGQCGAIDMSKFQLNSHHVAAGQEAVEIAAKFDAVVIQVRVALGVCGSGSGSGKSRFSWPLKASAQSRQVE